ncbi:MAG: IS66 family transposase [Steroidobacterales bacterium]
MSLIGSTPLTTPDTASILAQLAARDARVKLLEEEVRWLKAQLFGRSSERMPAEDRHPDQAWLFNEIETLVETEPAAPETITIPAYDRAKRGRKKLSADIPRVEIVHDLSEADKICPVDGTALERIGEETSEQLEVIPASVRVLKHIRPKYACPCCHSGVRIAPVPATLFPKSILTPSLAAQIATAKFVDGTPLYRQESQFDRMGIPLGRGTMALWMLRIGGIFIVPLTNLLNELLLAEAVIHCDETRLQVLKSDKAPTADHWMWVRAAGPPGRRIVLFDYDPSRGGAVPLRLLEGFRGTLVTDGYGAYDGAAEVLGLTHAGCMAHARRYFDEARKVGSEAGHAKVALEFIGRLSLIERGLWNRDYPVTPAERVEIRRRKSAPIMQGFHTWLEVLAPKVLPESRIGKAVYYTLGQWRKLTVFLMHGEVPMHNNRCENAIRPFVLGRKGWLFSDTVKGALASANLYSLVETCKSNDIEPHAYLTYLFGRLPLLKSVEDYEAVLPWNAKMPTRR